MVNDTFETKDIYLATTLLAIGYILEIKPGTDGLSSFLVKRTSKLEVDVANYMGEKLLVNALSLWEAYKSIKQRLYE